MGDLIYNGRAGELVMKSLGGLLEFRDFDVPYQ